MGFFSKTDFLILKTMIMKVFPEMTNFLLSVFHSGTPHRIVSKFTFFYHRIPENHHTFIIIIIIIIYIYIYIYI